MAPHKWRPVPFTSRTLGQGLSGFEPVNSYIQ